MARETWTSHETLRQAAAGALGSWLDALELRLIGDGILPAAARPLAQQILSLLEGSLVLSQTLKNPDPYAQQVPPASR